MDRLISEQAVLECFRKNWLAGTVAHRVIDKLAEEIKAIPSADKTGHWRAVYQGDEVINYRCSECGLGDTNGSTNLYGWDYCRRCGAKMYEPQERSE